MPQQAAGSGPLTAAGTCSQQLAAAGSIPRAGSMCMLSQRCVARVACRRHAAVSNKLRNVGVGIVDAAGVAFVIAIALEKDEPTACAIAIVLEKD